VALEKSGSADVVSGLGLGLALGLRRVRVRGMVKVINYCLITALPTATCAHPLFTHGLIKTSP